MIFPKYPVLPHFSRLIFVFQFELKVHFLIKLHSSNVFFEYYTHFYMLCQKEFRILSSKKVIFFPKQVINHL